MSYKAILSSKIGVVTLSILLIFFANIKYQQYKSRQAIEREKQILIAQVNEREAKNRELANSLNLLSTPDYKERAARQQLNLKKDGELVFNFTEKGQESIPVATHSQSEAKSGNPEKWWSYFFNN